MLGSQRARYLESTERILRVLMLCVTACTGACAIIRWQTLPVPPPVVAKSMKKYRLLELWRGDSVRYVQDAVIGVDSVRGRRAGSWPTTSRPAFGPVPGPDCRGPCRVAIPLAGLDSIRSGAPTVAAEIATFVVVGGLWELILVVTHAN